MLNALGKGKNLSSLFSLLVWVIKQTGLFSFCKATSLGEEKLNSSELYSA